MRGRKEDEERKRGREKIIRRKVEDIKEGEGAGEGEEKCGRISRI